VAIVGIATAAEEGSKAIGFSAVWSMFLIIGLVVGGTYMLRNFRTSHGLGIFLGASIGMSVLFFTLFAVFAGYSRDVQDTEKAASQAYSAFSFLLSLNYLAFSYVLFKKRGFVLPEGAEEEKGEEGKGGVFSPQPTSTPTNNTPPQVDDDRPDSSRPTIVGSGDRPYVTDNAPSLETPSLEAPSLDYSYYNSNSQMVLDEKEDENNHSQLEPQNEG